MNNKKDWGELMNTDAVYLQALRYRKKATSANIHLVENYFSIINATIQLMQIVDEDDIEKNKELQGIIDKCMKKLMEITCLGREIL